MGWLSRWFSRPGSEENPADLTVDFEPEYLIVGLGNPGSQYERTPHNLGFLVVDLLAERNQVRVTRAEKRSLTGQGTVSGRPVVLAKPQTFMNVNGPAVRELMSLYGLTAEQLIVVYDELDLPWGSLRIKLGGSAAGHNGVRSLLDAVGTDRFLRVRMGIHPGHPVGNGAKFVLAPFKRSQDKDVEEAVERAAAAVEAIIAEGAEKAMTTHNRRA